MTQEILTFEAKLYDTCVLCTYVVPKNMMEAAVGLLVMNQFVVFNKLYLLSNNTRILQTSRRVIYDLSISNSFYL
jgi:hypothetical protein